MKIMTVVGARPNFMKAAPIIAALKSLLWNRSATRQEEGDGADHGTIQHCLVHTGQHYDERMSKSFFIDLELPNPDVYLGVGSGSHAVQTGEIMKKFEEVLLREKPDVLIVVGDVNSTLACALVASKVSFDACGNRPIIAHVEAGLRSYDRSMPEEINRILTDHLADLLFVTEESGIRNLVREGIAKDRLYFVGNTMIDSLLTHKDKAESSNILYSLGLRQRATNGEGSAAVPYAVLTLHRPGNVDNRDAFVNILDGLDELAENHLVVFPVHPRTKRCIVEFGLQHYFELNSRRDLTRKKDGKGTTKKIRLIEPLGYLDFLCLLNNARLVVTDSGGIQEETTCLGIPCVTVRDNTERPITVEKGTNIIAGTRDDGIRQAIRRQMQRNRQDVALQRWDGKAAVRIVDILIDVYGTSLYRTGLPGCVPDTMASMKVPGATGQLHVSKCLIKSSREPV